MCILKVGWTVYCKQECIRQGVYTKGKGDMGSLDIKPWRIKTARN